jgi:hypothetical protein
MSLTKYATLIEQRIARQLVDAALSFGYAVSVNDDYTGTGEWIVKKSRDRDAILNALASTGGDFLRIRYPGSQSINVGWLSLIYGNDADMISDFSDNDGIKAIVRAALVGTDNEGLF